MATVVVTNQEKDTRVDYPEENDYHYVKERLYYINWIKGLGIVAVLVAIASIVLSSIQLTSYVSFLSVSLVVAGVAFLAGAAASVLWASRAGKTYRADAELFQPRINDRLTKSIFVLGLLLAGASAVIIVNLYVQQEYPTDYFVAKTTNAQEYQDRFGERSESSLINYSKNNWIVQGVFAGFFFFYFLLASRAAFRCLKWSNQAMSYLVFIGNVLLLAFGLGIVYFAQHAFGYGDYPELRAHFPVWNIRGLFIIGIAVSAISLIGFLIDHKSWRVGFFVLAFLLLLILVLLVNFTGYAYRHSRQTYEYYKGVNDTSVCVDRLSLVHEADLEAYGCPAKYLDLNRCGREETDTKWEYSRDDNTGVERPVPKTTNYAKTTTVTEPDGRTIITQSDGSRTVVEPDGTSTVKNSDKSVTTTQTDGQTTTTRKDGTTTSAAPDGTTQTTNKDGSTTTTNSDGTTQTTNKDGSTTTTRPDGSTTVVESDGTSTTTKPNGTVVKRNPDGSTTTRNPDGSSSYSQPDGTTTTRNTNGTTTSTSPDGTSTTTQPDGTVQSTQSDGTTTTKNNDGSVTTTQKDGTTTTTWQNGTTTTYYRDGTNVTRNSDESTVTNNKNGTNTTRSADGRTVTTQEPDGTTTVRTTNSDGSTTTTTTQPDGRTTTVQTTASRLLAVDEYSFSRNLDVASGERGCLNTRCCGLLGELYTEDFLSLANFGLLATLAGCLVSIGCYYFWYVTWVDSARDKNKDFIWLGVMIALLIVFFGLLFGLDRPLIHEKTEADGRHLEMIRWY